MSDAHARGPVRTAGPSRRWIVAGAASLIVLLADWYTYADVGLDMTALDMTPMAGSIGDPMSMGPQPVWTLFICDPHVLYVVDYDGRHDDPQRVADASPVYCAQTEGPRGGSNGLFQPSVSRWGPRDVGAYSPSFCWRIMNFY